MISFVYLRTEASRSLAGEIPLLGSHIQEAFSVSEAVWLCTQHHLGIIVVAENFEETETRQLRERFVIVTLKPDTTVSELLWKLMLPEASAAAS